MSIYGEKYIKESYTLIFDFIEESDNFVYSLFESTEVGFNDKIIDGKAKIINNESIIDRISKIWNKIIFILKEKFKDLIDRINNLKLKYNFIDDFVKKYGKDINISKISELKSKGWAGLSTQSDFLIVSIPSLKSTFLGETPQLKNVLEMLNNINNCNDEDEINDLHEDFKNRLDTLREESKKLETAWGLLFRSNNQINFLGKKLGPDQILGTSIDTSNDKKHHFPNAKQLELTKQVAENGEKIVKQAYNEMKKTYKNYKNQAKCDKIALKQYNKKEEKSNIQLMKIRSKYEFTSVFSKLFILSMKALTKVLKIMHVCAMKTYIKIVNAIKKYN